MVWKVNGLENSCVWKINVWESQRFGKFVRLENQGFGKWMVWKINGLENSYALENQWFESVCEKKVSVSLALPPAVIGRPSEWRKRYATETSSRLFLLNWYQLRLGPTCCLPTRTVNGLCSTAKTLGAHCSSTEIIAGGEAELRWANRKKCIN